MSFVINRKQNKVLVNNILFLSKLANAAKIKDNSVIDATVGMMFNDNYEFYTPNTVTEVIAQCSKYESLSYLDTNGGKEYHDAVLNWVFGKYLSDVKINTNVGVMATPGGSGAIGLVLSNYLNYNESVLLPSDMWTPYITMADERNLKHSTYNLYDENYNFDMDNFRQSIDNLHKSQENIVVIINDPCHNPTGLCMTDGNYDDLFDFFNNLDYQVTLVLDIAYIDYYSSDFDKTRERFKKLSLLNDNILVIFAFSGSKTFSLYGLRIGACVAMSRSQLVIDEFVASTEYTARSTWSNVSSLGVNVVTKIVSNPVYCSNFKNEVLDIQRVLSLRAATFIEESKKHNLDVGAYELGFFICIKCADPVGLAAKLIEEKVYVCPTLGCIRVAVSCISVDEASRLPKIIRKCLDL